MIPTGGLRGCWILACALLVFLGGCEREHEDPVSVDVGTTEWPPVPSDVRLTVGSARIALSWTVSDKTGVTQYRLYRAVGTGGAEFLAATTDTTYTDDRVSNGQTYTYRIAAVKGGLEGLRSAAVSAVPAVFSIVLENGALATSANSIQAGSRRIWVSLVAPAGTVAYQLSEDPSFAGLPFVGYDASNPVVTFALSPGDGVKTVYCRYRGQTGAVYESVSASILLDTHAVILEVTEDSGGQTLYLLNVLHLTLEADTTGGWAQVDLGDVYSDLTLFDDGTNGDPVAFDGTYERDFVIGAGLELVDGVVIGSFRDDVGNVADEVYSLTKLTIADPPAPVSFYPGATVVTGTSVLLRWAESGAGDFAEYRLYRSAPAATEGALLPVTTTDELVAVLPSRTSLSYRDEGLEEGMWYMWGITPVDDNGFLATSLGTINVRAGRQPQLDNQSLTPTSGGTTTPFTYECRYRHAGDAAPAYVHLVVDGAATYVMGQVGSGTNWVTGEIFRVQITLGAGSHTFSFEAEDLLGAETRLPAEGFFGGPLVSGGP